MSLDDEFPDGTGSFSIVVTIPKTSNGFPLYASSATTRPRALEIEEICYRHAHRLAASGIR